MSSFQNLGIILEEVEDYLVNVAKYSAHQAAQLSVACDNNQYDDKDVLIKDFSVPFEDCVLIDDDVFIKMFPNEDDRKQFFVQIQNALSHIESPFENEKEKEIKEIKESKYKYDEILNMDVTALTKQQLTSIKHLYQKQAPSLLTKNDDIELYRILALGRSNGLPLMQYITDTYSRMRINGHIKDATGFKQKYKLLKELRIGATRTTFEMAPASFHRRGLPETQIDPQPLIKIDDDINHFYLYAKSCIAFISNLVSSSQSQKTPLTPFQVDFWIIPKRSGTVLLSDDDEDDGEDDTDSDSDSDSDAVDTKQMDDIGDIADILKCEKLLFRTKPIQEPDLSQRTERMMREEYTRFIQELKSKTNDEKAPQFRRFNMILDRRKRQQNEDNELNEAVMDDFFIYSPPDDCNSFALDHVPEVFIANTKKCTLPKKGYNCAENELERNHKTYSASDQLNGSNFILSFHVLAVDDIKCYVYFNGTCVRFFPEDMVLVWPKWFKASTSTNKFINKREDILAALKSVKIRDDRFEQWYKMTTGLNDLNI